MRINQIKSALFPLTKNICELNSVNRGSSKAEVLLYSPPPREIVTYEFPEEPVCAFFSKQSLLWVDSENSPFPATLWDVPETNTCDQEVSEVVAFCIYTFEISLLWCKSWFSIKIGWSQKKKKKESFSGNHGRK